MAFIFWPSVCAKIQFSRKRPDMAIGRTVIGDFKKTVCESALSVSIAVAYYLSNKLIKILASRLFKVNGFFVESGSYDGEYLSNSLLFELHRGWTGLLIEPLSQQYNTLKQKRRKAFAINACLSLRPYPVQVHI